MKKQPKKEARKKAVLWRPNKILIAILAVLAVIIAVGLLIGKPCCSKAAKDPVAEGSISSSNITVPAAPPIINQTIKVELYHFHRTQQCSSCIQLGKLAEKTVNSSYADEIASGKLVFGHINYELPENSELSDKFEPTGASLWIGTTRDGIFYKEEDTTVWYKLWDEEGFKTYLKGVLDKRLIGDLS